MSALSAADMEKIIEECYAAAEAASPSEPPPAPKSEGKGPSKGGSKSKGTGSEAGDALVGAAHLAGHPLSEPRPCKDAHRCVTVSMPYRVSFAFDCYLCCRTLSAGAACGIPCTPYAMRM